ncbi:hypothetical protein [Niabella drilacis]|uniref:Beta-lactamase-inhibitor-like, PepSY-like n=1 Tax=Niabella drilacis (strain DSM 25811 / CCM 8410 / CCUG 62505 / LMG 26954 / E90) TaxID=1285928 RepID=A0A1G7AAN2_NIADE|nr:hypothetical protein [Niabella drilacis]SDE11841.1 hypothetical protein SAMN04487894_12223 [Niabella drilacis]
MKLFILTAALSLGLNAMTAVAANPNVNEKALKTFNAIFTNAQNVQWNTTADYNEASFRSGSISTRAVIDNNGALIRTIRYYKENQLPSNILYKIKKKYDGKEIYGITEVTNGEGTSYNIIVRDDRHIYNVAADNNGSVMQTAKYKRGDI